jgi:hypothetical protein
MLEDFLGTTYFNIEQPTIAELRLALQGKDGRQVCITP